MLSLAVSLCLVCGCFSWRVRPAVSLPADPTPPQPVALLSGVGFKGTETRHWLLHGCNPLSQSRLSFHEHGRLTQQHCEDSFCLWPFEKQEIGLGNFSKVLRAPPTGGYPPQRHRFLIGVRFRTSLRRKETFILRV